MKERYIDQFSLRGEIALITGGGTGLGFAMAQCFVDAGARVILVGRRRHIIEQAAEQLKPHAYPIAQDITRYHEADELVKKARNAFNSVVSILVNNAGNLSKKPSVDLTVDEFRSILDTHVLGAHAITRAFLPDMLERKHGHILFIASMASIIGLPQVLAYSAAKAAYCGMTRSLASELSPKGIRVNAIAPGWIGTAMVRTALQNDAERKVKILARTPMGEFGNPEDVGWAAVYLSSPAAKFVTGVMLPVDGGVSIGL